VGIGRIRLFPAPFVIAAMARDFGTSIAKASYAIT
jgi:hypothetical protein